MLELLKAVLIGIVEGITEWLPISSTGHMILLEQVVHFQMREEFVEMFNVVIQLGAILAVVLVYFNRLWPFKAPDAPGGLAKRGLLAYCDRAKFRLWILIFIATLPAMVVGLPLDDWLDAHLYNAPVVALMLIVYGVLFLVVESRPRTVTVSKIDGLTARQALIIGLWQVLALIPGTSRSGATIIGGLLLGLSRPLAARFTFYLAIPVMFGASGLKLVKFFAEGGGFGLLEFFVLLVGMAVAFVVSLLAIRFLTGFVKKHSFKVFGYYRIVLGIVVLAVFAAQAILG